MDFQNVICEAGLLYIDVELYLPLAELSDLKVADEKAGDIDDFTAKTGVAALPGALMIAEQDMARDPGAAEVEAPAEEASGSVNLREPSAHVGGASLGNKERAFRFGLGARRCGHQHHADGGQNQGPEDPLGSFLGVHCLSSTPCELHDRPVSPSAGAG